MNYQAIVRDASGQAEQPVKNGGHWHHLPELQAHSVDVTARAMFGRDGIDTLEPLSSSGSDAGPGGRLTGPELPT